LDVVLWWHHHQPWYIDPRTGKARFPWVRLHACRGYLDMATAAADPSADNLRHTFNFVPSLLDQLDAYADPEFSDLWLDLCSPAASDLDDATRARLQRRLGASGPLPVVPLPELGRLRAAIRAGARLTDAELTDLSVLAHLAFCGATLSRRPLFSELLKRGKGYSLEDKSQLLAATRAACAEITPAYRALVEAERVEITATPYFHPILPLIIDTDVMSECMPSKPRPPRFAHPEDASWNVAHGLRRLEEAFGRRPGGMWPAEGSVSDAAVKLLGDHGVGFCGTDARVLARSSPAGDPGFTWVDPSGRVAMFFRDTEISDKLGFVYKSLAPDEAAADLVCRARAWRDARPDRVLLTVILDGENPWEHYPNAGWDHLVAIQRALGEARDLRVVGPSRHLADHPPAGQLAHLHPGSWIDAAFDVWIGHPEDVRAWTLLAEVRDAIAASPGPSADAALNGLRSAEGSDFFWWFGDDFHAHDADLFDELFRDRIRRAWEVLGHTPPAILDQPIKGG
jgi:alpha-amylase/alpha-mannosidase (GH57 family)